MSFYEPCQRYRASAPSDDAVSMRATEARNLTPSENPVRPELPITIHSYPT